MRTILNEVNVSSYLSLRGEAEAISTEIPCGVYAVCNDEILRFAQTCPERDSSVTSFPQNDRKRRDGKTRRARNVILGVFSNEKGIALAMVLILSAIALAVMAGLIYMITAGTQISGMQKRYKTALEAGVGGADVTYQLIAARGDPGIPGINFFQSAPNACLTAKLNTATSSTNWVSCSDYNKAISMSINTTDANTYDFRFDLGASPFPTYRVYAKIVDTIEGNSGGDEGLLGKGVVSAGSAEVTVVSMPYLYTLEVNAENLDNPQERAKYSILYQY